MRRAQVLLHVVLISWAALVLAGSLASVRGGMDGWLLLALSAVIIASSRLSLVTFTEGRLSFLAGGVMVSFVVSSPAEALLSVALGTVADGLLKRNQLPNLLFNAAQMTVTGWVAFGVYGLVGGGADLRGHSLPIMATAVAFMLVNALLYACYLHAGGLRSVGSALRSMLDEAGLRAYLVVLITGTLVGYAYLTGGLSWAAVGAGLVYMLHSTLRRYFDSVREAQSQAQQLEAVLNATHGALVMTDKAGVIRVANRRAAEMLGVDPAWLIGRRSTEVARLQTVRSQAPAGAEEFEQVIALEQGTTRFVQWYRATIQHRNEGVRGHIDVFTDVTALKEAEENLRRMFDATVRTLTAAIDARDSYTHGHSGRVSAYSVTIGARMGLSPADLERIGYAGLLHDIGKLGVDDWVLRKHGALSPSERALMMQHPVIGAEVLAKAEMLADLIPGVRWHHEWISGGGYPDGLQGEEIPLDARIIGVADALDAMTSDRPYRGALSQDEALKRIQANAGVQFDPAVVAALMAAIDDGELEVGGGKGGEVVEESGVGTIRPVHGKELSIFYQLAREDYSTLNLEGMLQRYLETFFDTMGPNVYLVYMRHPGTGALQLKSEAGLAAEERGRSKDLRLAREALAQAAPLVVRDVATLEGYVPASGKTRSEAVIPLMVEGVPQGVLVVEAGVTDFFSRDDLYLLEALGERLSSAIKLLRYHERLALAATHDSLTGVYNHSYFYERLTDEVKRAKRGETALSLVLIDLNGLKAVNVEHGYQAGDQALREFAQHLQRAADPETVVARYGGDEFALIIPGVAKEEALARVTAWIGQLAGSFAYAGAVIPLPPVSFGVASFPHDGSRATELVLSADQAMWQEKRGAWGAGSVRT